MKIYLVGGAVRDQLLGLLVHERDWVVVGAGPEELRALGFFPVGKDFPVFLHPETHEEYALARTERKIGKGYKGFTFYAASDVTLEEDLKRRDLTINAMARSDAGELIDPFGGQEDLKQKILRHVSPAFAEDPVRILRAARFAAKFGDFKIAEETFALMRQMVANGEVDALVSERVWQEFERALREKNPERFFEVLEQCGALPILFPEIKINSTGLKALIQATELQLSPQCRFAALLHDVPHDIVKKLCQRIRTPREYSDLALLTAKTFEKYVEILNADAKSLLLFLKETDAIRRPERLQLLLSTHRAILATSNDKKINDREKLIKQAHEAIKNIDVQSLLAKNLSGKELAENINKLQLDQLIKNVDALKDRD